MSGISSSIPAADRVDALTVANQAARLALTATDVQPGDLVLQTDTDPPTAWVLVGSDPSESGNWRQISGRVRDEGGYTAIAGGSTGLYFEAAGLGYLGYWTATGLSIGNFAAEAPFHSRRSTGPQEIWEYADGVDARVEVDENGIAKFAATGGFDFDGPGIGLNGNAPVAQGAAIADANNAADAVTKLNTLLAYLRLRGDIDT